MRAGFDLEGLRVLARDGRPWKSLDELAGSEEARAWLESEFPRLAPLLRTDRRRAMGLVGAMLGMAALTSCGQPEEEVLPYVNMPEGLVAGNPLFFATSLPLGGIGRGAVVESREGRPVKVEGNPDHPLTRGASDAFMQADLLGLYDPDRSQTLTRRGTASSWDTFLGEAVPVLAKLGAREGEGLRLLTGAVTSPTFAAQVAGLRDIFPKLRWHRWQPIPPDNPREGARLAFGQTAEPRPRFDQARVILALDADFLGPEPAMPRFAADFAATRRVRRAGPETMSRLHAVEPLLTLTGVMADERLALRSSRIEAFARALGRRFGLGAPGPDLKDDEGRFLDAVARDLEGAGPAGLVVAGRGQPPAVHAIACLINAKLGAVGRTVEFLPPVEAEPVPHLASITDLARDMRAGRVEALFIVEANPVYDAPVDLAFEAAMERVPFRVRLALYDDETSAHCHWHVPAAHPLEAWSDLRGEDGTVGIVQPMIRPLWGGRTAHELLAVLGSNPGASARGLVEAYWREARAGDDFDAWWRAALQRGTVPNTALQPLAVTARTSDLPPPRFGSEEGLELHFPPDPAVYDGRYANNAWLQELPRPLTKQVWGNAVLIGPATASKLGLGDGDLAALALEGRTVEAPVIVQPGQAEETVGLTLGYGRSRLGAIGDGVGVNAYDLRTSQALWAAGGASLAPTGETADPPLIRTQDHHAMAGREIVKEATLATFVDDPNFVLGADDAPPDTTTLYPKWPYPGHAWGMSIDQTVCIGCNACVVACQAENNVPVVGPDEVARGREMHWLRVDRYYKGDPAEPLTLFQPVPCMQCEKAPCEPVCPVGAPVHDSEGLNAQVYNRCVGTRFCQSGCPYKVRRFNFFGYADDDAYANQGTEPFKAARNPEVTVRSRGVMEKCTYCVQRIQRTRIAAEVAGRQLEDGDIQTACQQACPTTAIVFGDLNEAGAEVVALKKEPHDYALLGELGTRPRTTYLARIRNPLSDEGEG
ncbi:MAG: TAT-variant-translocated molybdopterin oxidoreductase [Geminicoccaceae bacterium]|nr:TAT-variant-translocated molybdopterin oxidoreductase [Geminicoccaceae bacterium]